ncbi:MAG: hypothetical protein LBE36_09395 [Flavobacteriaceae bacterium]|nr:hypothetical protein [Flavobacteriaceae bacterium]
MKKIQTLTFAFLMFGCKIMAQPHIETLDMSEFKNQELELNKRYTDEIGDTIIEYGWYKHGSDNYRDIIDKRIYIKGSPYWTAKTYYKTNYQLRSEVTFFYRVNTGISKKYDENGNIVEEQDHENGIAKKYDESGNIIAETDYSKAQKRIFTIEDLIKKMKKEFDIDLLDSSKSGVGVDIGGNPFAYSIAISLYPFMRLIKINVNTGQLISDETLGYEK